MPSEWVCKTAHFDGISAQIAFDTELKCSLRFCQFRTDKRCETVRIVEFIE